MDPLEILRKDHHRAQQLLHRLRASASEVGLRMHLYAELRRELELHSAIEHDVFYPALYDDHRNRWLLEEAKREHEDLGSLLERLDATPFESPDWAELLATLQTTFEQHIAREEETLFERARLQLPFRARRAMARAMLEQRERLVGVRGSVRDLLSPRKGLST